ncbi:hypothetical protein WJX72_010782 [[Myrmecia] bisecta]|uniref:Uncharacterized protein n=1 Tax=[Myrmecia] bisecta TaxID=41462 RepID=A0AAW1R8E8_9CHLO
MIRIKLAAAPPNTVYFSAKLTFSHAVADLTADQLVVYSEQRVVSATSASTAAAGLGSSDACSTDYTVIGMATLNNPYASPATTVTVGLSPASVTDVCGQTFQAAAEPVTFTHRLDGQLYAVNMAYTSDMGATTDKALIAIAAVFTQPLPQLSPAMFNATGPRGAVVTSVERVEATASFYSVAVRLPEAYAGHVEVLLNEEGQAYMRTIDPTAGDVSPVGFTKLGSGSPPLTVRTVAYRVLHSP